MMEEWITKSEWLAMLARSQELLAAAEHHRRMGLAAESVWRELRPLNQRIRSPRLMVRGIDDRNRP